MALIHASCVAIADIGVLLRGAPGSGKSDLALRLIDGGAALIADDSVVLSAAGGRLVAASPPALAGLIEVRGLGILRLPARAEAAVGLVCDLAAPGDALARLPEPETVRLEGIGLPRLVIVPFHASAPAILRLAVKVLARGDPVAGALGDALP